MFVQIFANVLRSMGMRKLCHCVSPGERGTLCFIKEWVLMPSGEAIQPSLCFAVCSRLLRVSVKTIDATIDLRDAQVD